MATIIPAVPRTIFTVLEPVSLVAGYLAPLLSMSYFTSSQIPSSLPSDRVYDVTPTERVLALQLGNLYGLLGMLGLGVLHATREKVVVRNYLIACAIADVGHIWATCSVLGSEAVFDIKSWNAMTWGNIGATTSLLAARMLYLAGTFDKQEPFSNDHRKNRAHSKKVV